MPVIQVAHFSASDAFLNDPSILNEFGKIVQQQNGCRSAYYGVQIEDKKTGYFAAVWDSFSAYDAWAESSAYAPWLASLEPALVGPYNVNLAECEDATNAFEAPITELSIGSLLEGKTDADVRPFAEGMSAHAHLVKGCYPPVAWGQFRGSTDMYGIAVGWDTLEDHANLTQQSPHKELMPKLLEVAKMDLFHANLTKVLV